MAEIDLTTGDSKSKRGGLRGSSGPSTTRSTRSSEEKDTPQITDSALDNKLCEVFTDIADWREKKEDTELAEAIRESHEDMAKGLVALTRTIKWLRGPLAFIVNFVKPILAFGKPGRILGSRIVTWRMNRQQAQSEQESPYISQ